MRGRILNSSLILFILLVVGILAPVFVFAGDSNDDGQVSAVVVDAAAESDSGDLVFDSEGGVVVDSAVSEKAPAADKAPSSDSSEAKDARADDTGSKTDSGNPEDSPSSSSDSGSPASTESSSGAGASSDAKSEQFQEPPSGDSSANDAKEVDGKPAESAEENLDETAPKITGIVIEGNDSVPTDEIIKVMSIKIGDPLVPSKLQRDIQAIFNMGLFTDVKVDQQYFVGGAKIILTVLENPRVKTIVFEGNSLVPSEKLLSLMETKEGEILNTKVLYGDTSSINQYYNDELGYLLKPTHVKDIAWTENGELKIKIVEGMEIKDIEIVGNTAYTTEKLRSYITFKKGELFNQKTAKADTDKIAALYEKDDYMLDTIRPVADPETGIVSIKIVEAVVEEIKIDGNTRTKDYVILRNMNTKPGQILKSRRIQKDLERLNGIGYFSSVNIEPESGSDAGKVVLVIKVKEQKTGQVTLGLGYTGGGSGVVRSGVTGGVSVMERNFKGTGWGGAARVQLGVNSNFLNLSVFNPAINSNRDSISFSYYSQKYVELTQVVPNSDPVAYSYYDDKRNGFVFSYGRPLSEYFTLYLTLKTEKITLTRSDISDYEPVGLFDGRANSAILAGVYDSRDDMMNPRTGTFVNASFQTAGGFLGGDEDFTKTQLEIRKYIPVGKSMTLALRAWGGIIEGDSFSSSDVFYLGGSDSLRGYHDNIFMGDRMILLNAELRFPIAKLKVLSGAVFVDAGNAWFKDNGSSKLHMDAGVGLRLTLPTLGLGVIRLDYASGDRGSRVSIGFGQSF